MILAWAVIVGFLIALIRFRGDTLNQVAAIPLQYPLLVLLAVGMQIPLLRSPGGPTSEVALQQVLFLLSHLFLLVFVWLNRRIQGVMVIGIGLVLNLLIILLNSGFMPIAPETLVKINAGTVVTDWPHGIHYGFSKDIILTKETTRLWLFSDILVIPPPFPFSVAFSFGDILISIGIIALLAKKRITKETEMPIAGAE